MTCRVALTMRVTQADGYHEPRDSISHDWVRWLTDQAMTPLFVPNTVVDPANYLDGLNADLLVLTGGDDVGDPPERAATENALLEHAKQTALPVLGVCRGLQVINMNFGGDLTAVEDHVGAMHPVHFATDWSSLYGEDAIVNSFHNMGVTENGLGDGLIATAWDKVGHIEAVRHESLPVAAVMWHPEREGAPTRDTALLIELIEHGNKNR